MSYATVQEFKDKINLKSLPDELKTDEIIADYLTDASAEIFSYIACSYEELKSPYDAAIKKKTIDLAYYYLMVKRGFKDTTADQSIILSYEQIVKYLRDIANRKVLLSNKTDSSNNLLNDAFVII